MNKSDFEKAIKKKKEAQERAAIKLKKKQSCPVYKADQIAKANAQRKRQLAKQIEKRNKPLSDAEKRKTEAALVRQEERRRASLARSALKAKAENKVTTKPISPTAKVKPKVIRSKEKPVNKSEKELHNRMGQLGCIVCRNMGLGLEDMDSTNVNYISIHHCDGRTKPNCHLKCLPLCQWHHDQPMPLELQKLYPDVFPIHAKGKHGGKSDWEKMNGTQKELIKQVWELIGFTPILIEFDQSTEQIELASILAA